jgi:carbonic anhydrase
MTSCNATAPIDIPTGSNVNPISGTFNCIYDANLCSGASVTVSADLSYLSIPCSGGSTSNTISFYGKTYVPSEIRIYAPSLHTYNGSSADAEMLIVHTSGSSSNEGLIVSVPITLTTASDSANSDLAAIFQAANTITANTIAINASAPIDDDINVNTFIPAKPYYVYYGTLPYDSCSGNYYYAAFTDPISTAGPLGAIMASNIATVPQSMKTNLQKSKTGPVTGVGSGSAEQYVMFQLIGHEDDAVEAEPKSDNGPSPASQSIGLNIVWGILIAIALLGVAYIFTKSNASADATGTVSPAVLPASSLQVVASPAP